MKISKCFLWKTSDWSVIWEKNHETVTKRCFSDAGCHVLDPVQEVADFGVDAVLVFIGAALPPAYHAHQEPGFLVKRHQRTAAVTVAGVMASGPVPGAEHVPGDVKLGVEAALLERDPRQHQSLEETGDGASLRHAATTGHGGVADGCHHPHEGAVPGRKANGHHKVAQFQWGGKLHQGQVAVVAGLVVAWVEVHFDHTPILLHLLRGLTIMFPCTGTEVYI